MTELLIALCIFFVFYTYVGYPLLLLWMTTSKPAPETDVIAMPRATVVIAAFNEEGCIGETLTTILASDYPPPLLDVVVVSDASTDRTEDIVNTFPAERVRLLHQTLRSGQTMGLFHGTQVARGEIVILADASGHFKLDTVRRLVRHFANPRVGAVSGFKTVLRTGTAVSQGDGTYAHYDIMLRSLESRTGSSWVGCQGGLFAIRKELFDIDFPLDVAADNALCYRLYEQGYLHRVDPTAVVQETPPQNLGNEFRRKIRIIVLQLHGIFLYRRLFNPWRHPSFFFQNVSHKVFRWLVPFALVILLAARVRHLPLLFYLQCLFYGLAAVGIILGQNRTRRIRWMMSIPAYFVTVNAAGLCAWIFLFRNYTLWNPPARDEPKKRVPTAGLRHAVKR